MGLSNRVRSTGLLGSGSSLVTGGEGLGSPFSRWSCCSLQGAWCWDSTDNGDPGDSGWVSMMSSELGSPPLWSVQKHLEESSSLKLSVRVSGS